MGWAERSEKWVEMGISTHSNKSDIYWLVAALSLVGIVLLRTAWLAEDAFITFRTVDNWVNGYGLTWNVAERVQTYSHPLWMLLLSAVYALTREIYYTSIFLSIFVSLGAVAVFALRVAQGPINGLLAAAFIVSSKAFSDYSTSGLENPLSHLLMALFYAVYLSRNQRRPQQVFWLVLIAALAAVNRLDSTLIFAPTCAYAIWRAPARRKAIGAGLLGSMPLWLWELFSLLYYGFPFPNTAYAKLATGVPALERLQHGAGYIFQSLHLDPLSLTMALAGVLFVWLTERHAQKPLALGVVFYVLYVLVIGGDFMSGRFLTMPFWGGLMLVLHNLILDVRRGVLALAAILVLGLLVGRYPPLLSGVDYAPLQAKEDRDERGKFYPHTGLLVALQKPEDQDFPDHWWAVRGRSLRRGDLQPQIRPGLVEGMFVARATADSTIVVAWSNIGLSGFYAGPRVHIVDAIALADPLLARLPAREDLTTGTGHYGRIVPEGYLQSLVSGRNQIADLGLAAYYEVVREVTRGDLLSIRRLSAIWKLNTGQHAHLIQRDYYRHPTDLDVALSDAWLEPRNPAHFIELGRLYFERGEERRAIESLERALKVNPASFLNFVAVGQILYVYGRTEIAQRAYDQAIRNSGPHLIEIEAAGDDGLLLQTYLQLAEAHLRLGQVEHIEAVVRIYREIIVRDFAATTHAHYAQMAAFFRSIDMAEASAISLQKAAELEIPR